MGEDCAELIFIEPGVKINGAYYRDELLTKHLLPAIKKLSDDYFTFQQDSAPAHRARETVELLSRETPDFITPLLWPPNSPDLNQVDYKVWSVLQERVYRSKIRDVEHLKVCLVEEWSLFSQNIVDATVKQWRVRLKACVKARVVNIAILKVLQYLLQYFFEYCSRIAILFAKKY